MPGSDAPMTDLARAALQRRGRRLAVAAIGYMTLEGGASLVAGTLAGSVALVGFGLDSVIELASNSAALYRLGADRDPERRARAERLTGRIIAACFLLLAVYVAADAYRVLSRRDRTQPSVLGIGVAATSMLVMPFLARAKRKVATALTSRALASDARQADFCAYLSAILLIGLVLNAWLGWWWADSVAALVMVPIIVREGVLGWRGTGCCDEC